VVAAFCTRSQARVGRRPRRVSTRPRAAGASSEAATMAAGERWLPIAGRRGPCRPWAQSVAPTRAGGKNPTQGCPRGDSHPHGRHGARSHPHRPTAGGPSLHLSTPSQLRAHRAGTWRPCTATGTATRSARPRICENRHAPRALITWGNSTSRDVLVRAAWSWGSRGRRFKSCQPDREVADQGPFPGDWERPLLLSGPV
jgi:hypothetical protein